MEEMRKLAASMEPERALAEIAKTLKTLLPVLDEKARTQFILDLTGESQGDKVSSMVHL